MQQKWTCIFKRTGMKKFKLLQMSYNCAFNTFFIFMRVCKHMFIQLFSAMLHNSALSLFPTYCYGLNQLWVNNKDWCNEEKIESSFLGLPIIFSL